MSAFSLWMTTGQSTSYFKEEEQRISAIVRDLKTLRQRASNVLHSLLESSNFQSTFLCQGGEALHFFHHVSNHTFIIDALTRCSPKQVANIDTYKFTAHPTFEKKISIYTRTAEKPNPHLSKCRPWDIGLCVIVKVEALDAATARLLSSRQLFREFDILKFIWDCYMRENLDLDEMTGIPMVFDYTEVSNPMFNYDPSISYKVIDVYGSEIPWKSDNQSTLSYMSMEKLGPTIKYLRELMNHTRGRAHNFDIQTGFKVFDQLICRCFQIHRFGVVHGFVEPRNIYFGRSIMFNVVYLANYSKARILDGNARKIADVYMGGNPRYASQFLHSGGAVNPLFDLESAFYTLLSMVAKCLPWDRHLQVGYSGAPGALENMNASDHQSSAEGAESHPKVLETKFNFWRSNSGISRVVADIQYMPSAKDNGHINLAMEIIMELYNKLRDQFQLLEWKTTSMPIQPDYQLYLELRRITLMFFRFESINVSLCTPTYQKKIEAIANDEEEPRPAWNISNWCFSTVQMKINGDTPLSLSPDQIVIRTEK